MLFLGTALVVTAAYLRKRKLDKQAFIALAIPGIVAVALVVLSIPYYSITSHGAADRARESSATNMIGAINRSQQAFYLGEEYFADNFDQLDVGIQEESDYYKFEIVAVEDDMTTASATPKQRGLKSMIGAVFLVEEDDGYASTKAILCKSNKASRKVPSTPVVTSDGELQCASGSSEN